MGMMDDRLGSWRCINRKGVREDNVIILEGRELTAIKKVDTKFKIQDIVTLEETSYYGRGHKNCRSITKEQ